MSHHLEDPKYPELALYRKLRDWCLKEGSGTRGDCRAHPPFPALGAVKYIRQDLEGHPLVNPEILNISVAADSASFVMEIAIQYLCDGKPITNPVVMVKADGDVIRTHGDFHRLRQWVEETLEWR